MQLIEQMLRQTHLSSLYAMIDLANLPFDAAEMHRWLVGANAVCVFGDPSPSAQLASPWLLSLPAVAEDDRALRRTIDVARRSSAVTWLSTSLSAFDLARRLLTRTDIQLPDSYGALLRHFDPRVLPVLHRVLKPEQREAFFALGQAWFYIDRHASLCEIELTPAAVQDGHKSPMQLDATQFAALLESAEIDAVMPELIKEEPDRFLALGGGPARYRFTEHWLGRARHWKLDGFPQKVVLCTLALHFGPGFDEEPVWQRALGQVADARLTLSEAIRQATRDAPPLAGDERAA